MCGRYLVSMEDEIIQIREIINEVNEKYKETPVLASMKTGEVFPTENAPVIVPGGGRPAPVILRWGFPRTGGKGVIINARAETTASGSIFAHSFEKRRCLIPASGFFEWRKEDSQNIKYLFREARRRPLYFAGVYDSFPPVNGVGAAYVIITTAANPSVKQYHDRMPLIIPGGNINQWLFDRDFALKSLKSPCGALLNAGAV